MLRYEIPNYRPVGIRLPSSSAPSPALIPRQVVLMGSPYRPAPYRPAPFCPPTLGRVEARPVLGSTWMDKFENAGTSVLFAAGGAGAMYAAPLFPDPVKTIVLVGGIGLIGYAVYSFFRPPEIKSDAPPPQKTLSISEFQMASGNIIYPASGAEPVMNTWTLTNNFDIKAVLFNGHPTEPIDLTYDVIVQSYGIGIPVQGKNWITNNTHVGTVHLDPGKNSGPIPITIPLLQPPEPGLSGPGMAAPTFSMDLTLRKFDGHGNAVPTGDTVKLGPFEWR